MKLAFGLAAVILFTAAPLTAGAKAPPSEQQKTEAQTSTASGTSSTGQGIKKDAAEVNQGIKNGAAEVKQSIKNGATQVKRKVAVAQCNDGRYSYTTHKTCNEHGGVRTPLR